MSRVLVVAATDREARPVREAMTDAARADVHGVPAYDGALGGVQVRLAVTGVARANTAYALSRLLLDRPAAVVQVGVGGSFDTDLLPLTHVAVATSDTYADLGSLTDDGWIGLDEIGLPLIGADRGGGPVGTDLPSDPRLVGLVADHLDVVTGPFLTTETITGTRTAADALRRRTGAIVESMEGAAAAHACRLAGVRFVQLRAVSNAVGPRDRSAWQLDDAIDAAGTAAIAALPTILAATDPGLT